MVMTSGPFDGQSTTEAEFARLAREWVHDGVAANVGDTDLLVTADSSGMNVDVAAGYAIARGCFFRSTASEELTIDIADSQPRIDVIVLRNDPSVDAVTLEVLKGTAAASPAAPALTQNDVGTYEFALANVLVDADTVTIAAGKVTDRRTFLSSWTTATRPTSPRVGRAGFNATSGKYEVWDGSAWVPIATTTDASALTTGTLAVARLPSSGVDAASLTTGVLPTARIEDGGWQNPALGSGYSTSSVAVGYRKVANEVSLRGDASRSSSGSATTVTTLPVGVRPAANMTLLLRGSLSSGPEKFVEATVNSSTGAIVVQPNVIYVCLDGLSFLVG
jgi:hypothetical protein